MTKDSQNIDSSLSNGLYLVYDMVNQIYDSPFCVPKSKIIDDIKLLVNTYGSKYYYHENDYLLYEIGDFDTTTGMINLKNPVKIGLLNDFVDESIRKRQTILHTLNTIPNGYHKMPEEMRKDIQSGIDQAIKDYVQEFCDLDSLSVQKS